MPDAAAGTGPDPIFNLLASSLAQIGLGGLFQLGPDGSPGGWLWDQMRQGIDTNDELMLAIQNTDVFKDRFSVIGEQQRRAGAGEPVYVMTPREVIEYETRARQMMSAAGLPEWFYDKPNDFNKLILSDISLVELEDRIVETFEWVDNAPVEVRDMFEEYYGVANTDGALAAYALDPDVTTAQLERARRTAYTAGMAQRFDLTVSRAMAERIAELPRTEGGIVEGLQQIAANASLFDEGIFERDDVSADDGLAAVFEGDAAAMRALERRRLTRAMPTRSSTGGAIVTNRGLTGAGST